MQFGLTLPPFGDYADPRFLADAARSAEAAGWAGFFVWDHVFFDPSFHPVADPWIGLAAAAAQTTRIRLGTLITPIARRRPWILARQTVSLDRLSEGRLTLGVGLGDPVQWDFGFFGEETDAKRRAEKLDEGLEILVGLWSGEFFQFHGNQYTLEPVRFRPVPLQTPRIPIWVGGGWPNPRPMRRAARWDGYYPLKWGQSMSPEDWRTATRTIRQHRTLDAPFDFVHGGRLSDAEWAHAAQVVTPYAEVGVTWWIEDVSPWRFGHSWEIPWQPEFTIQMDELIRRGPPAL